MIISGNINSTNFNAKFFHSKGLEEVAKYAVEQNKFDRLDAARKNIDSTNLRTRLLFEYGKNEKGYPFISFTRFEPKSFVLVPKTMNDYNEFKPVIIEGAMKNQNPLAFALKKLIAMGNSVPHNKIFKKVILNK